MNKGINYHSPRSFRFENQLNVLLQLNQRLINGFERASRYEYVFLGVFSVTYELLTFEDSHNF